MNSPTPYPLRLGCLHLRRLQAVPLFLSLSSEKRNKLRENNIIGGGHSPPPPPPPLPPSVYFASRSTD